MSTKALKLGARALALTLLVSLLLLSSSPAGAVSPVVSMNPDSASVGSLVTFSGTGFLPGEKISVEFGGSVIAATSADGNGTWSSDGLIPTQMPTGSHPIDFNGDLGSWYGTDFSVLVSVASTTTSAPVATTTTSASVVTTTTSASVSTTAAVTQATTTRGAVMTTLGESVVTIPLDAKSSRVISTSRELVPGHPTTDDNSVVLGIMSLCLLGASLATAASALSKS